MRRSTSNGILALVLAFTLAGCGTPGHLDMSPVAAPLATASVIAADVAAPPLLPAPVVGLMPTVRVSDSQPGFELPSTIGAPSTETDVEVDGIRLMGERDIPQDEARQDATSAGYTLQQYVSVPGVTGRLYRAMSPYDYMLDSNKTPTGESRRTIYTLRAPDMTTRTFLSQQVGHRISIKGLFSADNIVTVTFAQRAVDWHVLTDWWTKGKLMGTVRSRAGVPMDNAEVKARSAEGFVQLGNSDATGSFQVKNLAPGSYQIWFSKANYGTITRMVDISAHKALTVEGSISKIQ